MKPLDLILLVDDDETTNYVNNRTLQRTQAAHEVKIFTDGEQAIRYLQAAACTSGAPGKEKCPDMIFLDIKMPIMDGFEFLEAYKSLGLNESAPTKIMMLTSSASFYDLKRLETYSEVKRHFSKPLADQDIKEIIREYFPENAH
ncbi:MAG: response regulator [Cytophagales bacterium CG18_big_fil_WC_8_21_14_2_50_42_9]|nr:MAG: response regulator [Cytophagales bacterium CG18_big_fil_WC_8_21_14_2_50_42_9]